MASQCTNQLRSADMLKLWGYIESAACKLCAAPQCTLHHIISNCHHSLNQGRYTWRHDSVLLNIKNSLEDLLPTFNNRKPVIFEVARDFHASFVREGQTRKLPRTAPRRGLLDYANDWKMLVGFKHDPIVFPPMICPTRANDRTLLFGSDCYFVRAHMSG